MSNHRSRFRVFRDLVCGGVCYKCSHPLTANSAIIVHDDANNRFIYGPRCAKKECANWGIENLRKIPDLTGGFTEDEREEARKRSGGRGITDRKADARKTDESRNKAMAYIHLRVGSLKHIRRVQSEDLSRYYREWCEKGDLPLDNIRHINNIEQKLLGTKLSYDNLLRVYTCDHFVRYALMKIPSSRNTEFLQSIRKHLGRDLALSDSQISGVENWVNRIPSLRSIRLKRFEVR